MRIPPHGKHLGIKSASRHGRAGAASIPRHRHWFDLMTSRQPGSAHYTTPIGRLRDVSQPSAEPLSLGLLWHLLQEVTLAMLQGSRLIRSLVVGIFAIFALNNIFVGSKGLYVITTSYGRSKHTKNWMTQWIIHFEYIALNSTKAFRRIYIHISTDDVCTLHSLFFAWEAVIFYTIIAVKWEQGWNHVASVCQIPVLY